MRHCSTLRIVQTVHKATPLFQQPPSMREAHARKLHHRPALATACGIEILSNAALTLLVRHFAREKYAIVRHRKVCPAASIQRRSVPAVAATYCLMSSCTLGIRVDPPTSTTSFISPEGNKGQGRKNKVSSCDSSRKSGQVPTAVPSGGVQRKVCKPLPILLKKRKNRQTIYNRRKSDQCTARSSDKAASAHPPAVLLL